ncbi:hypothetical protein, partial [Thermogutta sp.]|uniref:hypothetical protein n=1 Tax=Thermogutta sp. TaxID=1962930 RepID=UPI0032202360
TKEIGLGKERTPKRETVADRKPEALLSANEVNRSLLGIAHQRLDELCREAEAIRLFGSVQVQIVFEAGRITHIHRRLDGREKI